MKFTDMTKDFKILVVDDTPALLDIAVRIIKNAGYTVFSAADGAECMQELRREKPDIIMLDVILPDVNGNDLAAQIKGDPEFASVFIILLSSFKTNSDHVAEGLEVGADGYIIRPVEKRELLARIAAACRIVSAENNYKVASVKYHSLFSSMQEGVYLHEMVYDEHGKAIDYRIIEANPASELHLSIKPEDAIGKLATELYVTEEAPFIEIYAEVTKSGKAFSFEQYFAAMGKYFHISVYSPEKGQFATTFSDITIRKQAEEKINLKNEALQKLNAEKDKFFSIIAHDLRNPFSGFLGLTQIMAEKLSDFTINQAQELAESMRDSASNLYRLLENLLQWSQIQRGTIPFNPEFKKLLPVVNESVAIILESANAKHIEIITMIPDGLTVFADINILQTVIRNLVSNAVKFTPKGGKVSLTAKTNDDNSIEISVQDTGIGVSQKQIENLFRIDVQTSRKGTEGEPGTGLGLLLCKEFVEKHAGRIWVESNEGKGSIFNFTLPFSPGYKEENGSENEVQPIVRKKQISNLKIIIAEDEEDSFRLISIGVQKFAKEIITARTGIEAVEACRNNPDIDLVLMDIQMPDMNGYEATRQIRKFNPDLVIIAQTAFALIGDREKALESGCTDYVSKPIRRDQLIELMEKHFS